MAVDIDDFYVRGHLGVQHSPAGALGGGGAGFVLVGGSWTTLPGFTDQTIGAGSGYLGVFHDLVNFANGVVTFDGTNVGISDASGQGIWYYGAQGKIVGTPSSGVCRVVIAGLVYGGLWAGELSRQLLHPADFADGYAGYNLFATPGLAVGDNMGVYIDNQTDATLTIEQGDPNDGSGPPSCQVVSYLLNFLAELPGAGS